jgi:hypothetical protein
MGEIHSCHLNISHRYILPFHTFDFFNTQNHTDTVFSSCQGLAQGSIYRNILKIACRDKT